jgi:hypothetical protein
LHNAQCFFKNSATTAALTGCTTLHIVQKIHVLQQLQLRTPFLTKQVLRTIDKKENRIFTWGNSE